MTMPRRFTFVIAVLASATAACAGEQRVERLAAVGDPERGKAVFINRQTGHCLLCHSVQSVSERSQGNIGPALDNVGARLTEAQLRLRVVDSTQVNPDTAMPSYYRTDGLTQVASEYTGKTVLSAQEVEDVVAFLRTLNGTHHKEKATP